MKAVPVQLFTVRFHKRRPERERGDLQLHYGELDFKIPVGLLSLDGQRVFGYMSLHLKVKAKVRGTD